MKNKYSLKKTIADEEWDRILFNSLNPTIFSTSVYLNSINSAYDVYYCFHNKEIRALVVLLTVDNKIHTHLKGILEYNGIIFNQPTNKQNTAQIHSEQYEIQNFIAYELIKIYSKIHIRLHPTVSDIRAFLWVNYGETKPKYISDIRYTSVIDIAEFNTIEDEKIPAFKQLAASRRQEIRRGIKEKIFFEKTDDVDMFANLYRKTFERQNIQLTEEILFEVKKLIKELLKHNMGHLYMMKDENLIISSMAFFGIFNNNAYYIFGANNPETRNLNTGTLILWNAFKELSKIGVRYVDLIGINSPKRGSFKVSFGGTILPYYTLLYQA